MPRLSPAELASHRLGMGSTDVVEALGLAPWAGAGPMRVYLAKTGEAVDNDATDEQEWGHEMETVIADWYARTRGVVLIPGGHVPSSTEPWLWATLDRKVQDHDRIVEVKNVGAPQFAYHWDSYVEDGVPRYLRAQCMIGMYCLGVSTCDVVACVGGRPPCVWTIGYDAELARMLVDGASRFWHEHVMARVPPELDATPATKEYLRRTYPGNEDRVIVEADPIADAWGQTRATLAEQLSETEDAIAKLDAKLLARVGSSDGLRGEGWKMTWKLDRNGVRRQRFTAREW